MVVLLAVLQHVVATGFHQPPHTLVLSSYFSCWVCHWSGGDLCLIVYWLSLVQMVRRFHTTPKRSWGKRPSKEPPTLRRFCSVFIHHWKHIISPCLMRVWLGWSRFCQTSCSWNMTHTHTIYTNLLHPTGSQRWWLSNIIGNICNNCHFLVKFS